MDKERRYVCIDLKSFYASVECVERGYDPLKINLVVADNERTEKTICLAVSPALKSYGIPGRLRLFEVVQKVKELNKERKQQNQNRAFLGKTANLDDLKCNLNLAIDYVVATPRMALYIQYSTKIYSIYLKYIAKEDIHVYSIDEVFIDVTDYLKAYKMTAAELVKKIIQDVYQETGITATAGIGTNMYLAKVAMDIEAKHIEADEDGVRIAFLDEKLYRKKMWHHEPLTDFWRVGRGYLKKLAAIGLYTMGDIARASLKNEEVLYKLFGVNAELLIDHAWGYEPTTISEIKNYKPDNKSMSTGQVLQYGYKTESAKLVVKEMTEQLVLDLVAKNLVTDSLGLSLGYEIEDKSNEYEGEMATDYLGRNVPKPAHSSIRLQEYSSSTFIILEAIDKLFDKIVNPNLLIRRINIGCNTIPITEVDGKIKYEQLDLFTNYDELKVAQQVEKAKLEKEKKVQKSILNIKNKYGKNAVIKGMNKLDDATMIERNKQIGGHKA